MRIVLLPLVLLAASACKPPPMPAASADEARQNDYRMERASSHGDNESSASRSSGTLDRTWVRGVETHGHNR